MRKIPCNLEFAPDPPRKSSLALKGTVSKIGAILDPNIRTAKVRLEVRNSGMMRVGMSATATFYGQAAEMRTNESGRGQGGYPLKRMLFGFGRLSGQPPRGLPAWSKRARPWV